MVDTTAIGIDLGTTYSCVAVFQNGEPKILTNDMGNRVTPSYITLPGDQSQSEDDDDSDFDEENYSDNDDAVIGDAAKNEAHQHPHRAICGVKRFIGQKFDDPFVQENLKLLPFEVVQEKYICKIKVNDTTFLPEEISARLLRYLKKTAEERLGHDVTKAVITVPAYFKRNQRKATKEAGKLAGLEVLRIINEPTAAAMAYNLHTIGQNVKRHCLIFDLGGGTFDVATLLLNGGKIEMKCVDGHSHLGGDDFDNEMAQHCIDQFSILTGVDLAEIKTSGTEEQKRRAAKAMQRLKAECERQKKFLSSTEKIDITLQEFYGGHDLVVPFRRSLFNQLNDQRFQQCMTIVRRVVQNSRLDIVDIDEVILVGGSSRIPRIKEMLEDIFGKEKVKMDVDADEVVAKGAALCAHQMILDGIGSGEGVDRDEEKSEKKFVVSDVVQLPIGVEIVNTTHGKEEEPEFTVVIPKYSKIPCSNTVQLLVRVDDDEGGFKLNVFEGHRKTRDDCQLLGSLVFSDLPPPQGGQKRVAVELTMELDDDGILQASGRLPDYPERAKVSLTEEIVRPAPDNIHGKEADAEETNLPNMSDLPALIPTEPKPVPTKIEQIEPNILPINEQPPEQPSQERPRFVFSRRMMASPTKSEKISKIRQFPKESRFPLRTTIDRSNSDSLDSVDEESGLQKMASIAQLRHQLEQTFVRKDKPIPQPRTDKFSITPNASTPEDRTPISRRSSSTPTSGQPLESITLGFHLDEKYVSVGTYNFQNSQKFSLLIPEMEASMVFYNDQLFLKKEADQKFDNVTECNRYFSLPNLLTEPAKKTHKIFQNFTLRNEEVIAIFLVRLKKMVEQDQMAKVSNVVFALSFFATSDKRERLEDAAKLAGFKNVRLISSPLATVILEVKGKNFKHFCIAQYNPQSFSVSIIKIGPSSASVVADYGTDWMKPKLGREFEKYHAQLVEGGALEKKDQQVVETIYRKIWTKCFELAQNIEIDDLIVVSRKSSRVDSFFAKVWPKSFTAPAYPMAALEGASKLADMIGRKDFLAQDISPANLQLSRPHKLDTTIEECGQPLDNRLVFEKSLRLPKNGYTVGVKLIQIFTGGNMADVCDCEVTSIVAPDKKHVGKVQCEVNQNGVYKLSFHANDPGITIEPFRVDRQCLRRESPYRFEDFLKLI